MFPSAKVEPTPIEPLDELNRDKYSDAEGKYTANNEPKTEGALINAIMKSKAPSGMPTLKKQFSMVLDAVSDDVTLLKEDYSVLPDLTKKDVDHNKAIIRVRELLVSKQQKEHLNPKSIFNLIYNNKFPPLRKALKKNPELINDGDAVGANPVHVAYLYRKYEIGRWIVSNFPDESLLPYSDRSTYVGIPSEFMPYYGENILHMCIIRRDHTEVRFLLDFYRDRLTSVPSVEKRMAAREQKTAGMPYSPGGAHSSKMRVAGRRKVDYTQNGLSILLFAKATGSFFAREGNFYCGETPLHFAVCCGDTDMFDVVLAYAASERPNALFERDSHGNTLLHLCVMHNLTDMYKHVLAHARSLIRNQISLCCADAVANNDPAERIPPVLQPMSAETLDEHETFHAERAGPYVFKGSCPRESALPFASVYDEVYIEHQTIQKLSERLTLVLNSDLHSPLTYAASLGNYTMLTFLVDQMKVFRWRYGPVSVSSVDLDGLEIPHNLLRYGPNPCKSAAEKKKEQKPLDPNEPRPRVSEPLPPMGGRTWLGAPIGMEAYGAIEHLCEKYLDDESVLEAFDNDFIKDLINAKWHRSAYYEFRRDSLISAAITFGLTLIACVINFVPTLKRDTKEGSNVLALLYSVMFIFVTLVSIKEIPQVVVYRLDYWGVFGGIRGAAIYEKLCMTAMVISFYMLCLMETIRANRNNNSTSLANGRNYVQGDNGPYLVDIGVEVSLVVSAISAWSYLFFSFMGLDSTGPFVLKIFKIINKDVPFFLQFFGIVIMAFSVAVSLISNINEDVFYFWYGFFRFLYTIWTFIKITVGAEFIGNMVDVLNVPPELRWVFDILMFAYGFFSSLLMLNLLIAIIGTSYEEYSMAADQLLLLERYNIMCGYERGQTLNEKNDRLETFAVGDRIDVDGCLIESSANDDEDESTKSSSKPINLGDISKDLDVWRWLNECFDLVASWCTERKEAAQKMKKQMEAAVLKRPNTTNGESIRWTYKWEVHDKDWFNRERETVYMPDSDTVKIILLIIDPQNDFHDDPEIDGKTRGYTGTLAVGGATADSIRISEMIRNNMEDIDEIYVTLDTHHKKHIAHASFWEDVEQYEMDGFAIKTDAEGNKIKKRDADGNVVMGPIPNFTIITHEEVKSGVYVPKCPFGTPEEKLKLQKHCEWYTKELAAKGRFQLCIWPEHCRKGTRGQAIVPVLNDALTEWCSKTEKTLNFVNKTESHLTEMYSALEAEVVLTEDRTTMLNRPLLSRLKIADQLIICGEAKSHCVNYTTRDIAKHWHKEKNRICVLTDGCSSVPGFEDQGDKFFKDMEREGCTLTTTLDAFDLFIGKNKIRFGDNAD